MSRPFLTSSFTLIIALAMVIFSCHRPENDPDPNDGSIEKTEKIKKIKTEFLISGIKNKSWVVFRYFVNGQDLTQFVEDCNLDNILIFYNKGGYSQLDGPEKCYDYRSDVYDCGSWSLNDSATIFHMKGIEFNEKLEIIELKSDLMRLEFDSDSLGVVQFHLQPIKFNAPAYKCEPDKIIK